MCYGLMLHVTFIKFMTSSNHVDIYDDNTIFHKLILFKVHCIAMSALKIRIEAKNITIRILS